MRYARGMFRLWLVLSCFWIAAVAAIGYSNWPSATVQQATSKDDPNATYVLPECGKGDPNNAYADFCVPKTNRFAEALKVIEAVEAEDEAKHLAVTTAELAFTPPALIFVVGLGLTWALRGFRPR